MTITRSQRFKDLLLEALALELAERSALLDERCRGDLRLREEIESVLDMEIQAKSRIEEEDPQPGPAASLIGQRLGRIRVVELLAQGGMGEVYVGFDEKLKRKVALKAIRAGRRLSPRARGRFLREAQTLSALGHPNICQIYDLVETPAMDLLVLELVAGKTLGAAIRDGIEKKEKLEIGLQICEALAEAHARGIIHRDLKPDNVMVREDGRVKILDFGLARAIDPDDDLPKDLPRQEGPDRATTKKRRIEEAAMLEEFESELRSGLPPILPSAGLATAADAIVGTPGYLSPEQARCETLTAASDCYSLGLVLQELFTGAKPYEESSKGLALLLKASRSETLPVRGLDRDLTACIEKLESPNPAERPTAREARAQLEWIRQKPVRWFRRISVALAILVIAAGISKYVVDLRDREQTADTARRAAEQARESEVQVTDFFVDLFEVSDPGEARGSSVTAREILDRGATRIMGELAGQPLVQARLMETIGMVYNNLGLYEPAEKLLQMALVNRQGMQPPNHPEIAAVIAKIGELHSIQGRYEEAESFLREALRMRELELGSESTAVATSLNQLGNLLWEQGEYAEAEPVLERALSIQEKALGPDDPAVAHTLNNLALICSDQGRYDESEPLYQRSLAIYETAYGEDHPDVAKVLNNLGMSYWEQGRTSEVAPYFERSLAIRERTYGPDHFKVAMSLNNLAMLSYEGGDLEEAERLFRRALSVRERSVGPDHRSVAMNLSNLGMIAHELSRFSEAENLLLRALEVWQRGVDSDHPDIGFGLLNLGNLYTDEGRYEEARPLYEKAINIWESALGKEHIYLIHPLFGLGKIERKLGRSQAALPFYERAIAICKNTLPEDHPDFRKLREEYTSLLRDLGQSD